MNQEEEIADFLGYTIEKQEQFLAKEQEQVIEQIELLGERIIYYV